MNYTQGIASRTEPGYMRQGDEEILNRSQLQKGTGCRSCTKNRYSPRELDQLGVWHRGANLTEGHRLQPRHRHNIVRVRCHVHMIAHTRPGDYKTFNHESYRTFRSIVRESEGAGSAASLPGFG